MFNFMMLDIGRLTQYLCVTFFSMCMFACGGISNDSAPSEIPTSGGAIIPDTPIASDVSMEVDKTKNLGPLDQRDKYDLARKQWQSSSMMDYGFTLERRGWDDWNGDFDVLTSRQKIQYIFSPKLLSRWKVLTAEERAMAEAASAIFTIDELFDDIDSALNNGLSVNALYDEFYGYPYHIEIVNGGALNEGQMTQGTHKVNNFYIRNEFSSDNGKDNHLFQEKYYEKIEKVYAHYKALWESKKPDVFGYTGWYGRGVSCHMRYDMTYVMTRILPRSCFKVNHTMEGRFGRALHFIKYRKPYLEIAFDREYGYPYYANYDRNPYFTVDFEATTDYWEVYYRAWGRWRNTALNAHSFTLSRQGFAEWNGQFKVVTKAGEIRAPNLEEKLESVWSDTLERNLTQVELVSVGFTVKDIFEVIGASLKQGHELEVQYDDEYSFPSSIYIDNKNVSNAGSVSLTITDFVTKKREPEPPFIPPVY